MEQLGINGLIQLPLHVVYCIAGPFEALYMGVMQF